MVTPISVDYRIGLGQLVQRQPCIFPTWWRHQMEAFSALLALCAGNSPVTGEFPLKGQWRGALMLSFICARINGWVNNREAGDLRRHRAHYDDIVMKSCCALYSSSFHERPPTDPSLTLNSFVNAFDLTNELNINNVFKKTATMEILI